MTSYNPDMLSWLRTMGPASDIPVRPLTRLALIRRLMFVVIFLAAIAFSLQLMNIQIRQHRRYQAVANGNRLRERVLYAPRGRILDRKGKVLAESVLSSQLVVYPYLLRDKATTLNQQINTVATILGKTPQELSVELLAYDKMDIQAHIVAQTLDQPTIIALEKNLPNLPAFDLQDVPTRHYNSEYAMGTILGFTGLVPPQNIDDDDTGELLPTDTVGREGVEASYDAVLRGVNGRERIEVDALGRPVSLIARQQPKAGRDIYLTIDMDIQKALASSVQKYMEKSASAGKASGIIVDPNNGEVLAMVSLPNYDNNEFVGGISAARYSELNGDLHQPLVNKVITNGYPTGSIIKPLVASAALQEKVVTPETTIVDRGFLELRSLFDPGVTYRYNGWNRNGLGPMQVRSAIANSSNIYFFTVGGGYGSQTGLGVERLTRYYRAFGLGDQTGIRLPHEMVGRVPDPVWKKRATGLDWFQGDTYNISIGQGDMLVSPLQITMAESSITNGGKLYRPKMSLVDPTLSKTIPVDPAYLQVVREGMRQTVVRGTTSPALFGSLPIKVAAKSGTAETDSPGGRPPHSWYVAYAPYENPKYLATVLVEEGREGVSYSAPAIAETFSVIFSTRQP